MLRLLCPLCLVSVYFMRNPMEKEPVHITKSEWIDREKVIDIIRNENLTKEERIGKIKLIPIHESEGNMKIWIDNQPKVIDFFDWAALEKKNASEKAQDVIRTGEGMFGTDFMMLDDKEQSFVLLHFFDQMYNDKDVDDDIRDEIIFLAEKFKDKLDEMGFDNYTMKEGTLN